MKNPDNLSGSSAISGQLGNLTVRHYFANWNLLNDGNYVFRKVFQTKNVPFS
jgi:hypothetical protein